MSGPCADCKWFGICGGGFRTRAAFANDGDLWGSDPGCYLREEERIRAEGKQAGAPEIEELRDYGGGAQILTELGVHDMVLLTNTHHTLVGLEGYGLSIVGERAIPGTGGE